MSEQYRGTGMTEADLYRVLVEHMWDGAAVVCGAGTVRYANAGLAQLVGAPAQALNGAAFRELIAEESRSLYDALMVDARQRAAEHPLFMRRADGRVVPAHLSIAPVPETSLYCLIATDLSTHRRYEELLRRDRLARSVFEQADEALVFCDHAGRVARVSPAARALATEEPLLRGFTEVFPLRGPDGEDLATAVVQRALAGQDVHGQRALLQRATGPASFSVSAGPLHDDRGEPLGCLVTLLDRSARERSEREAGELREQLDLALEAASAGTWIWYLQEQRVSWAPQLERLCGLAPGGFDGRPESVLGFVHEADRQRFRAALRQTLEEGGSFALEHRVVRRDGSHGELLSRGRLQRDAKGAPERLYGVSWDITELREGERVRQRLATVLEESPDLVAMAGADGALGYLNRAGRRLLGLGEDEAVEDLRLRDFQPPDAPGLTDKFPHPVQEVSAWSGETVLIERGGRQIPVMQLCLAHGGEDGVIRYYSTICRDLTQRERDQRQLRRLNRTYAAVNECNRLVIQAEDEQALLEGFCRSMVEVGGYRFAWAGVPEPGPEQLIRPIAQFGTDDGYLASLRVSWSDTVPEGRGPGGRAFREARIVTTRSVDDADFAPWHDAAAARGFRSTAALPVVAHDRVAVVLSLYAAQASAFDDEELGLLESLRGTLSFALESLRTRSARRAAERELQIRDRAIAASQNGIMITDLQQPDNPLIYVNPAFERITGYRADEVLGRNPRFLVGAARDQPEVAGIRKAVREGVEAAAVLRNYRKDGSSFWNRLNIAPVRDPGGGLSHFVGVMNDVTAQKDYEAQLEYQAQHDALTGLPNRNLLHDRLDQALAYARRHERQVAVLFLDLDRFKLVNDSLAHEAGDELLQALGGRLSAAVRTVDTVCRYGGDEFVLVLTELASADQLHPMLRRIRAAIAEPLMVEGRPLRLTASIGAALFPADGAEAATLLRNADAAMYRAKELGRDQVHFYTAELNQRARDRLGLESALREALEEQRLWLAYQPQLDTHSGRIVGLEALVRWQDPERGAVPPDAFIPLAEETGLILPLGEWVLREACRQARQWREAGLQGFRVAVNVSARQIAQGGLAALVRGVLEETGLPAQALELELTETALMESLEAAEAAINELSALGVSFALDDFGTGYSSLGYLKRFRFDSLKIDRSFVEHLVDSPDDAAIVLAVIGIAHQMRMRVLAEGVETEAQLAYLRRHGCELCQGFYFSRPVPAEQAELLLRQGRLLELPEPPGGQRTLLLVDDEPNILRALRRVLRGEDYRVLLAADAREALELLAREPVQVVLADNRMPGMSGIELLSRVKQLHPEVVRMILSGYTDFSTISEAVNRGWIYKFIAKPWDDEELREHLREAFRRHARTAAADD